MLPGFIRITLRVTAVLTCIIIAAPFQFLIIASRLPAAHVIPVGFHRLVLRIIGARVEVSGPLPAPGTLIVSNHVSWLDILIIGSVLPVNFVAKADISGWPVFGFLAKLQNTLFINRDRRSDTANQSNAMQQRLAEGGRLVLFPEGTTGDGTIVHPFKSALFAAAEAADGDRPTPIQPLSVAFAELGGMPMSRRIRIKYAWVGEVSLVESLLCVFGSHPFTVRLVFHEPTNLLDAGGRKALAAHAHRVVQSGVARHTVGLSDGASGETGGGPAASGKPEALAQKPATV